MIRQHRTAPSSCSAAQRRKIMALAAQHGMNVDAVREAAGCRLHDLSSAQASQMIQKLSGAEVTEGFEARPRRTAKSTKGIRRMITQQHIDQINDLLAEHLDDGLDYATKKRAWLHRYYGVGTVRELATAERAGRCIFVLKRAIEGQKPIAHIAQSRNMVDSTSSASPAVHPSSLRRSVASSLRASVPSSEGVRP